MDNGSKFGTLVLVARPWSFQNKLNESENIAVQIGRTVLDFNLKKSWRLFPLCYSGENEVVNVHRRDNDQPQQQGQASISVQPQPPAENAGEQEGSVDEDNEQRPGPVLPNLPVPDYAAQHEQAGGQQANNALDGNGEANDRDDSVVEVGAPRPDEQVVVEPVDEMVNPAQAQQAEQPPPALAQQQQPEENVQAVPANPRMVADRDLEVENIDEVGRLENRPTTFPAPSHPQNGSPAPALA